MQKCTGIKTIFNQFRNRHARAITEDSSNGGSCDYDVCGKIVEFDA